MESESFNIDMTPSAHIIESYQNTKITYPEALGELIDNSFDAGANSVTIQIETEFISVKDNGRGCRDLSSMLALGKHHKTETTKLGRYGVGSKGAMIGLGDMAKITSICSGVERRVEIDWNNIRSWTDFKGYKSETKKTSGTEVKIVGLRKTVPKKIEALKQALAFMFTPALDDGKEIRLLSNGLNFKLEPFPIPEFEKDITFTCDNYDGFGFVARGGILKSGIINSHKTFIICYEHRVIFETDEPTGEWAASPRFMVWVELTGNWPLLKHKDGLTDRGEWLARELNELFSDLLKQASEEGEMVELNEFAQEFEAELNAITGREQRNGDAGESGTISTKRSKKKRLTAESVSEKSGIVTQRVGRKKAAGFVFRIVDLGKPIGKVSATSNRIQIDLNKNHQAIKRWCSEKDKLNLKFIALALLCSHQSAPESGDIRQIKMSGIENSTAHDSFVTMFGSFSEQIIEKEEVKAA